jgi:hypothetical protein
MRAHTNYLLGGDASDAENWGDPKMTKGGKWAPLELVVAPKYRGNFMFMETVEANVGSKQVAVHLYKHDCTREYVNVDAEGKLYVWAGGDRYAELSLEEARGRLVGGLLHAIEEGVDISRDMTAAYERLAALTGISGIRGVNPESKRDESV